MVDLRPLEFRRATFDWGRTYLMGVVNVTPDSFSDGGAFAGDADAAIRHGFALFAQGADIVDVGGESTRPGAAAVAADAEIARVVPVVRALAERGVVSIDTSKSSVAAAAIEAGAEIVNDVAGGALDSDILRVVAAAGAAFVIGHLRGTPADMNDRADYGDVTRDVLTELTHRIDLAVAAGIARDRLLVDPGLGFAKHAAHNVELLARLGELRTLGCPIVVGASRKSFLGRLTGRDVDEREFATAAADTAAVLHGANVVRVHDVARQRDAVIVADAIKRASCTR